MDDQNTNINIKTKERQIIIFLGILVVALIAAIIIIIYGYDRTQNNISGEPQEQIQPEDYINVIYTPNGFVPRAVKTTENKINFVNVTNDPISISIEGSGIEYSENVELVDNSNSFVQDVPVGEYIVTEINSGIDLIVTIVE